ncbi:PREDICTED: uncharacterized protein LOC106120086 [Papilio xuthus]|uniref:Uncharacterized protein LOC106120086 n=1 Tax=Papilio xuthus TaxID=66420 RepID=A0A194QD63_PAPXU|nr:PREDICTED: uncharacterized protein LOC106120086 [Papilio xuthus]KPJ03359.1 hypothetical protein RR46_06515 [Papilio xuthus]
MAPRDNQTHREPTKGVKIAKKKEVKTNKIEVAETKPKTVPAPKPVTPKSCKKENKQANVTGSVTKSAKKPMRNRRPKPAHSGVPVPEKMRKCLAQLLNSD